MAVSVRRLIHRGEARDAVRDRIALEDALSTTLPQDGRLILIRKLTVCGELASPRERQSTVRRGWVEAVAGAVHATSPFAAQANCVWFASPAEAEAILLRKLLAGEPVVGWFWGLAVPGWRNLALDDWLPRRMVECLGTRDFAALGRMARACIEADRTTVLIVAATRALRVAPDRSLSEGGPRPASWLIIADTPRTPGPAEAPIAAAVHRLTRSVLAPAWVEMLASIEAADAPPIASRELVLAIVREKVRRASPALALDSRLLAAVAETLWDTATGRLAGPSVESRAVDRAVSARSGEGEMVLGQVRPLVPSRREVNEKARRGYSRAAAEPAARPLREDPADAPSQRPHALPSRHAGLWLVVPSLIRLGFREWLAERPELLGEDPGRRLLLAIALHHRLPRADPALAPLAMHEEAGETHRWIDPWRVGLDRWLRRTARRRTHDLVARPGWITFDDDRIDVGYPLDDADLRLRRLGLDSDAGWTDWLGLSLRFHFGRSRAL